MEVAKAMMTALMSGTLLTRSVPLNGFAGDRPAHAAARPGRSTARAALRQVAVIPRESGYRLGQEGRPPCHIPKKV